MARAVPSQVVELINVFYGAHSEDEELGLNPVQCAQLSAVLQMIDRMPAELITLSAGRFSLFLYWSEPLK